MCALTLFASSSKLHAQARARESTRASSHATSRVATADSVGQRVPPAALWDSLYNAHRYFALRDSVTAWRGPESVSLAYYRGLVALSFNQPGDAILQLKPLLDSMPRALTGQQLGRSAAALGEAYQRASMYREAGDAYRRALRSRRVALDSASRTELRLRAAISDALAGTLAPRVTWTRVATMDTVPNAGVAFSGLVRINDVAVAEPFGFDPTRRFTTIDAGTAAAAGVSILGAPLDVRTPTGERAPAHVGLARRLTIGPAVLSNVPVLVLGDTGIHADVARARGGGIIGFGVLDELNGVTYTRDGHIALSSPGVARADTMPAARIALEGVTPILEATLAGRTVLLTVEPSADRTVLYPPFLRSFPSAVGRDTALSTFRSTGVAGSGWNTPWSVPAYTIRGLDLSVGGRTFHIDSVPAITQPLGAASAVYDGSIGRDVFTRTDAVTLDFGAMTASLQTLPPPAVLPTISYRSEPVIPPHPQSVPEEIGFIALLFALFIVPKALQRYRIPGAITSLVMGVVASGFGQFQNDPTLHLLSTLGIVALFLFAGLEIDGPELRANVSALALHAAIWSGLATVTAAAAAIVLGMSPRSAALMSLALVTPSTGFILSSVASFGLTVPEQRTVKTYAVGSELLALAALFFVLQSTSAQRLLLAVAAITGVVIIIPLAFRFFASVVAPYAPRSEFAFLIMVAVLSAYATRRLGVYYLVGAFLVGVAAQRFRADHPAMSSERMVDALESFGSVFIPFYFFYAGTQIRPDQLTPRALVMGLLFTLVLVPVRVAVIALHRRIALREAFASARRVGSALLPTLVFTLVIVGILHDSFALPDDIAGALVLYTILNTTIPAFVLRSAAPEFDHLSATDPAAAETG